MPKNSQRPGKSPQYPFDLTKLDGAREVEAFFGRLKEVAESIEDNILPAQAHLKYERNFYLSHDRDKK